MRSFAQKQKPTQKAKSARPGRAFSEQNREIGSILHLQRTIGNQAVQRLIQANPKDNNSKTLVPPIVQEVLSAAGVGQPLDSTARRFMESRFGHDFSRVRVFNNSKAAESADRMKAAAFTIDANMVFGKGWYEPNSNRGRRLIAHELTHVVQNRIKQTEIRFSPYPPMQNTQAEFEAERVSSRVQMGMKAGQIASPNAGIALTPVSIAIEPLLSYSATSDWEVTVNDERDILSHLRGDSNLSATITDLNSAGMLDALISRVDETRYRRELLQLLGANLNSSARSLVEPLIVALGSEWELQYNLGRLGVTAAAPAFSASAFSHLISSTPSAPFTGAGATGVNPTTLDISYLNRILLAAEHATTTAEYSNPIPGSLPAYLASLTPAERSQQAELLLQQPISSVESSSFAGNLPSRAQVITAAATAHNLHPEILAAFLLAEQRDQSRNEDAKDYIGATSILSANTSIGLGQVVISTARRADLFADLLSSGTRSNLGQDEIARLLASDEFNIFAAARYIRRVADDGSAISIATLPNTQSAFPGIDMAAYANNSATWPDDNIRALASEYTSRAWDDRLSIGWANFVFEAYRDVNASGVFP